MRGTFKQVCVAAGVAGLIAAYNIYSEAAHISFGITLAVACLSALLLVVGLIVHVSEPRHPR